VPSSDDAVYAVTLIASGRDFTNVSMLNGWLPWTIQAVVLVVLALAVAFRSRRWWLRWTPVVVVTSILAAFAMWWYINFEGLAGDPAPTLFWVWTALTGASIAVMLLGWPDARWRHRLLSVLAVPLCLLCTVLLLNVWVGYVRTTGAAWNFLTAGPPPNQADMSAVKAMADKGIVPTKGRIVPVRIGAVASGFRHRQELVYLPPVWFRSVPPAPLPVVMMIGGEFGTSADWIWAGGAQEVADSFAAAHGGNAPVLVFVDKGGAFNKDTECVNGVRGNAADYLTKDVVPYLVSAFGVSPDSSKWGIAGWSMGGTCALTLTVMYPELFSTFVDIDGDIGPNAGTREQTIERLFNGDEAAWEAFDPTTVMTRHGRYTGVAGVFGSEQSIDPQRVDRHAEAARTLAGIAAVNGIACSIVEVTGKHDWAAGAAVFKQTFEWLAARLGTPGVAPQPLPGSAVVEKVQHIGGDAGWFTASPG
jgi:S-formylglutathione hydrolase FrmB